MLWLLLTRPCSGNPVDPGVGCFDEVGQAFCHLPLRFKGDQRFEHEGHFSLSRLPCIVQAHRMGTVLVSACDLSHGCP